MGAAPAGRGALGVSLAAFQTALARLVLDPRWREEVHASGPSVLPEGLSERERRRLGEAAAHPGLAVTATLVRSFRLGKIITLLPLTRRLLGDTVLAREARRFWAEQPPRTFYALDEALAFAATLLRRRLRNPFLEEVVGFERAMLELGRPRPAGVRVRSEVVRFRHDPRVVLGALSAGRRPPRRLPERRSALVASLAADGRLDWRAAEDPA
jgi:hypothetical protein